MVFKSQNITRKCKYCDNPQKINITSGRHKGYYRTCGSKECTTAQYKDREVCGRKARVLNPTDFVCTICKNEFKQISSNHKRFCKICVPDKSWNNRARIYNIGKPQWDDMLKNQNGTCYLCDRNPEAIDHCHRLHIVRGLLCGACNMQIAKMDKDREWLQRALKYIGE